ncbi:MAG: hypothetical protein AVDCRST_MAG90-2253, partial [uncultured Microvirga sp.]
SSSPTPITAASTFAASGSLTAAFVPPRP